MYLSDSSSYQRLLAEFATMIAAFEGRYLLFLYRAWGLKEKRPNQDAILPAQTTEQDYLGAKYI